MRPGRQRRGPVASFLIASDIAKGALLQTGPAWTTGARYAAVGTSTAFARPAVKAFVDWLEA